MILTPRANWEAKMRPYEELCRITSLADLKLIKAILEKNDIEYFVKGDPSDFLLLHTNDPMSVMVKNDELVKAKRSCWPGHKCSRPSFLIGRLNHAAIFPL